MVISVSLFAPRQGVLPSTNDAAQCRATFEAIQRVEEFAFGVCARLVSQAALFGKEGQRKYAVIEAPTEGDQHTSPMMLLFLEAYDIFAFLVSNRNL